MSIACLGIRDDLRQELENVNILGQQSGRVCTSVESGCAEEGAYRCRKDYEG